MRDRQSLATGALLLPRPAEGRSWPQCEDFLCRWQLCLNWSWFPWQPISIIWAFHSRDFKGQIILEITWFSIPEQSPCILAVWVLRLPLYERILKTRSHRTISISKSMHTKSSGISPQSTSAWDGLLKWLLCCWCFFVKVLRKSKNFFFFLSVRRSGYWHENLSSNLATSYFFSWVLYKS